CPPGGQCSSNRYIKEPPLSFVKRNHFPSSSARTFFIDPRLSFTVKIIRVAFFKLAPSVKPNGVITGGVVSVTNWNLPNSRKRAAAHPPCHSTFCTALRLLPIHCITVRVSSAGVKT